MTGRGPCHNSVGLTEQMSSDGYLFNKTLGRQCLNLHLTFFSCVHLRKKGFVWVDGAQLSVLVYTLALDLCLNL